MNNTKIIVTVTGLKGNCSAGHKIGDTFEISCHNTGGLCGFFYHNIFPNLQTYQYSGKLPWWSEDNILRLQCPDPHNLLTIKIEKKSI